MKSLLILAALALASGSHAAPDRHDKPLRPCLNCTRLHGHNNSFCSADCCAAHRRRRVNNG